MHAVNQVTELADKVETLTAVQRECTDASCLDKFICVDAVTWGVGPVIRTICRVSKSELGLIFAGSFNLTQLSPTYSVLDLFWICKVSPSDSI